MRISFLKNRVIRKFKLVWKEFHLKSFPNSITQNMNLLQCYWIGNTQNIFVSQGLDFNFLPWVSLIVHFNSLWILKVFFYFLTCLARQVMRPARKHDVCKKRNNGLSYFSCRGRCFELQFKTDTGFWKSGRRLGCLSHRCWWSCFDGYNHLFYTDRQHNLNGISKFRWKDNLGQQLGIFHE